MIVSEYVLLLMPERFWLWYSVMIPVLLLMRYPDYRQRKWLLFYYDFCYYVQVGFHPAASGTREDKGCSWFARGERGKYWYWSAGTCESRGSAAVCLPYRTPYCNTFSVELLLVGGRRVSGEFGTSFAYDLRAVLLLLRRLSFRRAHKTKLLWATSMCLLRGAA